MTVWLETHGKLSFQRNVISFILSNLQDAEKLKKVMVKNIPKGSQLTQDSLSIKTVKFNYGMGKDNPLENMRFYSKNKPNEQKVVRKEEVSSMLPER